MLAMALLTCSLLLIWTSLRYSGRGIDLIDESFYLVSISNPLRYNNTLSQFGLAYHHLFSALGNSIAALRSSNIAITVALASTLAWIAIGPPPQDQHAKLQWSRLFLAAALGTTSLAMLRLWLPTPSYNWLTFQALLLTAIGLFLSEKNFTLRGVCGWTLIALGGWLAFLAKPTSAVAAGLISLVFLAITRRLCISLLCYALVSFFSLVAATAWLLDGSFHGFILRYLVGMERAEAYGMGHTLSSILRFDAPPLDLSAFTVIASGCLAAIGTASALISIHPALRFAGYLICLVGTGLAASMIMGASDPHRFGLPQPLFLAGIGLSAGIVAFIAKRLHQRPEPRQSRSAAALLAMLPFAFVLGTANNYWFMAGLVGYFWVLSGAVLIHSMCLPRHAFALTGPFVLAAQCVTVGQVLFGAANPYYQPAPVGSASFRIDLGQRGGVLRVAGATGQFIEAIQRTAAQAGFQADTPVIDLTGRSPGVLYVMGARSTGQPWLIGNFPGMSGSNRVATEVLTAATCWELARSWLLIEPTGPYRIPSNLISVYGADEVRDFSVAGSFLSPDPLSNFTEARPQYLLRPDRTPEKATQACNEAKAASVQAKRKAKPEAYR